jgi:hypothetical protein
MSSPLARAPALLDRVAGLQKTQSVQNLATEGELLSVTDVQYIMILYILII